MGFSMSDAILYCTVCAVLAIIAIVVVVATRKKKPLIPHNGKWQYRVVRTSTGFALHEVSFLYNDTARSMNHKPTVFTGGSVEEIEAMLVQALDNVRSFGVFDVPDRLRPREHRPDEIIRTTTETAYHHNDHDQQQPH